jgi:integrase
MDVLAFRFRDCYVGFSNHRSGPLPGITISKRIVDQVKPGDCDLFFWDRELKGFGLKVTPIGAKVYICQYRPAGGGRSAPTKRITIGRHGAPWAPDQARRQARVILGAVAEGKDPAAEKRARRQEVRRQRDGLFETLAEEFLEHGRRKRGLPLREATRREYRRALMTYAASLHGKPLTELRRGDIAAVIRGVARERGEVSAMRCRAALSRLFSWAIANGHAEANVVTGTEGYATPKRSRVLNDAELRALWAATAEPTDFNMIVRLCLWTGTRRSEPGCMAGSELDGGTWTVPGSRTKNGRSLALPLPRQAVHALAVWLRVEGRDLLFGRGSKGFQGWSASKKRLDAASGVRDWDLHDLRRTVETRLAGLGVPKEIVNRVLNHAAGPITEAYDHHDYLPEKATALQRWADTLDRIAGAPAPANVVALAARG